ncbi:MAG: nucleotidyltransferase domain-containing protein [Candidatus Sumerlaeota bacterium]|nr:nucleotidyltransferase domain-containing protein [Candidatus Sumerlaeota bacterium]
MSVRFDLPSEKLAAFCRKWKIVELAVFGSAVRDDFGPQSDIDFLARFADDAGWSLFDHAQMEIDLSALLGREVDLVSRRAIERSRNWIRRQSILESTEVVYAA